MSGEAVPTRRSGARLAMAWGVHLFTASGAVLGAIALLAIWSGDFARAALLMMACFAIDSVDGTLARRVGVRELIPQVDGRRLDDIVDYLNFTIVPLVFMVASGCLPSAAWVVLPVLASAYGFSQEEAKTEDDFFLGWPSYWNVLAWYLWLLELSPGAGAAWATGCAIAVFVPLKYVYPSKLSRPLLRHSLNGGGLLWCLVLAGCFLAEPSPTRTAVAWVSLGYPAYYVIASSWLGQWGRPVLPWKVRR